MIENPQVGDKVYKQSGDYYFHGEIISVMKKLSGKIRVAVENPDGIIHIFSPEQLMKTQQL